MSGERRNALPTGYQFEGYRIDSVLGAGGFGMTYKATEVALGRSVAIKEFLPSGIVMRDANRASVHPFGSREQRDFEWGLASFRKEAATLVTFRHPNIITVHRYFEANGTAYMVMAYEEGESLGAVLARHPTLDESEIREILVPLLDGLARVHEAGFLHRDIKPDNIYIRQDGSPVLLDFGAARQALGEKSRSMTSIFTAGYAPFEQYSTRGNQGPWTDIYALGGVLYRCVTGERPPDAPDRIRDDPCVPAAKAAKGRYTPALLAAIDHALAVDERARPQSIAAWRSELGVDAPIVGPAPARRRGLGWAVAALILLTAAGGATWYVTRSDEAARMAAQMQELQKRAAAAEAAAKAEAEARKRAEAEAEARRKAEDEARIEAEKEAKARTEAEARAAAAAKARAEEEAKRKAEDEARARAAEAKAKADAEAKARAEAEARAKLEADTAAKAQAEEAAKRRAAPTATQQAAATTAASNLRALVLGKTAYFDRPNGFGGLIRFQFTFRDDGTLDRICGIMRRDYVVGECPFQLDQRRWDVTGDQLCIGGDPRRMCFTVSGSGERYVFRQVSGPEDHRIAGDAIIR
jgi:hypothetical protein